MFLGPEHSLSLTHPIPSRPAREKAQELSEWIHQLESEKFDLMEKLKQQKYEVGPALVGSRPGDRGGRQGFGWAATSNLASCSTDQCVVQPHQPRPEIVSAAPRLHLLPPSLPAPSLPPCLPPFLPLWLLHTSAFLASYVFVSYSPRHPYVSVLMSLFIYLFVCLICPLFQDKVLLCSPAFPGTHYVAQTVFGSVADPVCGG